MKDIAEECNLENELENVEKTKKSDWKRKCKEQLYSKDEKEIEQKAGKMTKMRTALQSNFGRKRYIRELTINDVTSVMKMRLHMTRLRANYKEKGTERTCRLCSDGEETEEHILECKKVKRTLGHMSFDKTYIEVDNARKNLKAAKILEAVEKMLELRSQS